MRVNGGGDSLKIKAYNCFAKFLGCFHFRFLEFNHAIGGGLLRLSVKACISSQ